MAQVSVPAHSHNRAELVAVRRATGHDRVYAQSNRSGGAGDCEAVGCPEPDHRVPVNVVVGFRCDLSQRQVRSVREVWSVRM